MDRVDTSSSAWERYGGIAGILFFVSVLANFFTPETPDTDDPTVQIVRDLADDATGQEASYYLQGLGAFFFLLFVAALWTRLRRFEPERGPSVLVLLGGVATALLVLINSSVLLAMVEAAEDGRPGPVRALLELDGTILIGIGFTLATFYVGAALSARATGALPGWLAWVALAIPGVFLVTMLGVFSESDDGGVLGGIFFIALIVNFFWILVTSVLMLRAPAVPTAPTPAPGTPTTPA